MSTPARTQFQAALTAAYASLFASDPAYAYSASKTTPEAMAAKMMAATLAGSASVTGPGFRMACKACGIPHTAKAIDAFLGVAAPVAVAKAAPKPRKVLVIGLSSIHAMMTGVSRIHRAHDLVTLVYVDGKQESAMIPAADWSGMEDKPFEIVSAVQSKRVPANT
jgi:hypothetical protein